MQEGGCLNNSSPTLSRESESERPGYHRGVFVLCASISPSLVRTYSFDPLGVDQYQSISQQVAVVGVYDWVCFHTVIFTSTICPTPFYRVARMNRHVSIYYEKDCLLND